MDIIQTLLTDFGAAGMVAAVFLVAGRWIFSKYLAVLDRIDKNQTAITDKLLASGKEQSQVIGENTAVLRDVREHLNHQQGKSK